MAGLDPVKQLQYVQRINALDAMETGYLLGALCSAHVEQYLTYLCKECYADIIMVLLLDCSFAEYYSCIFGDECAQFVKLNAQSSNYKEVCQRHADRIALVSIVMNKFKKRHWLPKPNELENKTGQNNEWAIKALAMAESWATPTGKKVKWDRPYFQETNGGSGDTNRAEMLLGGEARELLNYLEKCANGFFAMLSSNEVLSETMCEMRPEALRKVLSSVKEESFDWAAMNTFIEQTRKAFEAAASE